MYHPTFTIKFTFTAHSRVAWISQMICFEHIVMHERKLKSSTSKMADRWPQAVSCTLSCYFRLSVWWPCRVDTDSRGFSQSTSRIDRDPAGLIVLSLPHPASQRLQEKQDRHQNIYINCRIHWSYFAVRPRPQLIRGSNGPRSVTHCSGCRPLLCK